MLPHARTGTGALLLALFTSSIALAQGGQGSQDEADVQKANTEESVWDRFVDPEDGGFDVSAYLLEHRGILPMPILITEPAIGYGGGLALTYFHSPLVREGADPWALDAADRPTSPPSITSVFGAYTEDDNWMGGAFHFGSWREDTIRYVGAVAKADLNLDFYVGDQSFGYELEAPLLFQRMMFRVSDSPLFLGGSYLFVNTEATFDFSGTIPGVDPLTLDDDNAAVAAIAIHDTRDNIFTPNRGHELFTSIQYHGERVGGDFRYWEFDVRAHNWHPLRSDLILGLRADGAFTNGNVPFYGLPYIDIRGIPALRYQGEFAGTLEAELRWDFTYRWSLIGFGGAGYATNDSDVLPDPDWKGAGGFGFRYLLARSLGLRAGIDVGFSAEDEAIYIQTGNAWTRF